jgi:hypothetical protein
MRCERFIGYAVGVPILFKLGLHHLRGICGIGGYWGVVNEVGEGGVGELWEYVRVDGLVGRC